MKTIVPIFADQLSVGLSALGEADPAETTIVMMEVAQEAEQVAHHRKKLVFLFSAMRHFAESLAQEGWNVRYVKLDDADNTGSFDSEMKRAVKALSPDRVLVTEPGEYRVEWIVKGWGETFGIPVRILDDTRFFSSREEFAQWAKGRKQLRMEYFYRAMRRKTGFLMNGRGEPEGGKWNYDAENRKPASGDIEFPKVMQFTPDRITDEVAAMVEKRFPDRFGQIEPFWFAVTRGDAKRAARHFVRYALPRFGDYQDAMLENEDFLFHSVLSLYLNTGLLDANELCRMTVEAYDQGNVPLNSAEGFLRQIIGWREYIRGIYWLKMPDYLESNALEAKRDLPWFYWDAKTKMNCLARVVDQTRRQAYAHHIQRLMITGTFALLAGIDPRQVHEWYLAVYADAFEWVELPNTLGMSQYGDGGLLASKPYAASGAYINRMSDYCGQCRYDVKQRIGDDACPFNALYWNFLDRNRNKLADNRRLAMPYRNLEKMNQSQRKSISKRADQVFAMLDSNEL